MTLHFAYAKSEARIREKLATWGHSTDGFDKEQFLAQWQRSAVDWENVKDFHIFGPQYPRSLLPFTLEELRCLPPPGVLRRAA